MGYVDGPVEEEGPVVSVPQDELFGFAQRLGGEELPFFVNLLSVAPEVVPVRAAPVIEVRVAVDAASQEAPEIVESPAVGGVLLP